VDAIPAQRGGFVVYHPFRLALNLCLVSGFDLGSNDRHLAFPQEPLISVALIVYP
jgi:hypothetical protein